MFSQKTIRFKIIAIFSSVIIFGTGFVYTPQVQAIANLKGRILLQVQDKGQAWYVSPVNNQRYYLGRPNDAFLVMRSLGLGVTNNDINLFLKKAPANLAGRILLKVQDKGQAYYVDPIELKLYYLGRPEDAFLVMRNRGLGISNRDLNSILVASSSNLQTNTSAYKPIVSSVSKPVNTNDIFVRNFSFKYNSVNYDLAQNFSNSLYNRYKNSNKVFTYYDSQAPENLREAFYGIFFNFISGDKSLDEIIVKLKKVATDNNWNSDELLEFVVSFVQYIPYDETKVSSTNSTNDNPFFPYETLYLNKGVCSDKTFLALALLRKLGYGAAILDFPDINHSALGFACPREYSINNSGYCYGETTNYFPLGVIPRSINNGQAQNEDSFDNLFNTANLGRIEIYQKSSGKIYGGIPVLKNKIESIKLLKNDLIIKQVEIDSLNALIESKERSLNILKSDLDSLYSAGRLSEYNSAIVGYNKLINEYNLDINDYKLKINYYNLKINELNKAQNSFYQQ